MWRIIHGAVWLEVICYRIGKDRNGLRRNIERLPEGVFLATSNELQGLVAQGRTVNETLEIARDVARKPIESQAAERPGVAVTDSFDFPLLVSVEE